MIRDAMRRIVLALVVSAGSTWAESSPADQDAPKRLGLTERAQRNLAQFEVALTGPRDRMTGLIAADFDVTIAGKEVVPVAVDSLCPPVPAANATASTSPAGSAEREPESPGAPTSYLFYFDQRNLTLAGRLFALETADGLVRRLIRGGNRGAVVSSGKRLVTLAPFTESSEVLLAAIGRIRNDPTQWDDYASLEPLREEDVVRGTNPDAMCGKARTYQREEYGHARQTLDLLTAVLGRFATVDAPKAAIYFSDTLRDQPGRHYVLPLGRRCVLTTHDTMLSFREVHDAAAAYGVVVYGIEAEGIAEHRPGSFRAVAQRDSQGGLKALALDTGGDAFLNGAGVNSMVEKIQADSACVYLVSFDPAPFPRDKPLSVEVRVTIPGVRARTRTHLVVQSESARRTAMLLSAFTAPDDVKDAARIQGGIVPLDVQDGHLRILVQASLPETEMAEGETWDMGMSLVSGGDVPHEASGRVTVDRAGVKLLLESDMDVAPGPFEVALAAVEDATGKIASGRLQESWAGTIAPSGIVAISVLQPTEGAFVRDGTLRRSGSMIVPAGHPVHADLPTALVTLVCRTEKKQTAARVHRALTGATEKTFPTLDLSLKEKACVQVRDVLPAGSLAAGTSTYTIGVEGAAAGPSREIAVTR